MATSSVGRFWFKIGLAKDGEAEDRQCDVHVLGDVFMALVLGNNLLVLDADDHGLVFGRIPLDLGRILPIDLEAPNYKLFGLAIFADAAVVFAS